MDIESITHVMQAENRYIIEKELDQSDILSLIVALKVNSRFSQGALATIGPEHTIPLVRHGAGLIYNYFQFKGEPAHIIGRANRASVGEWLLHFDRLLIQATEIACNGQTIQAENMVRELYNALLTCFYQHNGGIRRGYE